MPTVLNGVGEERAGERGWRGGGDVSEREAVHVWQRQYLGFYKLLCRYKWMIYRLSPISLSCPPRTLRLLNRLCFINCLNVHMWLYLPVTSKHILGD